MGESKVIDAEFEDVKASDDASKSPKGEKPGVMDQVADFLSGVADAVEDVMPSEDGKEIANEVRRCSSAVISAKDGAHKLKDAYEKVSKVANKISDVRGTPFIHRRF